MINCILKHFYNQIHKNYKWLCVVLHNAQHMRKYYVGISYTMKSKKKKHCMATLWSVTNQKKVAT